MNTTRFEVIVGSVMSRKSIVFPYPFQYVIRLAGGHLFLVSGEYPLPYTDSLSGVDFVRGSDFYISRSVCDFSTLLRFVAESEVRADFFKPYYCFLIEFDDVRDSFAYRALAGKPS